MRRTGKIAMRYLYVIIVLIMVADTMAAGQDTGTLRGRVTDEIGGVIVGATVSLLDWKGSQKVATTNNEGGFVFSGLAPGKYSIRVTAESFAQFENPEVEITTGRSHSLDIKLIVAAVKQKLTVENSEGNLSTDPQDNAGGLVLKGKDLDALPDDPDDLAVALQAMAGPAAGPNGGQIYIDGFSGGSLPPKELIREVRINQNPFAAENDRIGYSRIEILTKVSANQYHSTIFGIYNDQRFNSRNPYSANQPPYQLRMYGGNVTGPVISNRVSMFLNLLRREINDNSIINATVLDPALNVVSLQQAVVTPRRFLDVGPRIDYQLNSGNTLVARYNYSRFTFNNMGIGEFILPSRAFNTLNEEQTLQVTETAILSESIVNETRLQYIRTRLSKRGDNSLPGIVVEDSFNGGGSPIGFAFTNSDRWELQNYMTWALGKHTLRFGGRVRAVHIDDLSSQNFPGSYLFLGGVAPLLDSRDRIIRDSNGQPVLGNITSLERYRRTLAFQREGLDSSEIAALGGEPTFLTIAAGNQLENVEQVDFGGFIQDDWRARPNFTFSYGLRYEAQNNIKAGLHFAPRLAFAWSPRLQPSSPPRTVIRGGVGIFYERFAESYTLQANRYNGINQQQYTVTDPSILGVFPKVPSAASLAAIAQPQNITRVASDLTSPYTIQSGLSLERQLSMRFSVVATYLNARGLHYLRSRNINAPLPGTFVPGDPASGVRPFGNVGNIFEYESSGVFKQHQLVINATNRLSPLVSIFATYALSKTDSDTDGAGHFPSNTYDLRGDFGRSALDVRHRAFIGGSITLRWSVNLSPLVIISSGAPFNITTGQDSNGDTKSAERPAFATDLSRPGVRITRLGAFDLNPAPGANIIPRNFGEGPGYFSMSLRVGKNFSFTGRSRPAQPQQRGSSAASSQNGSAQAARGSSSRSYSLNVSVLVFNLLNHTNPGIPIGNLSSTLFGQSNFLGTPSGVSLAGGNAAASNRRLDLNVRFFF